MELHEELRTRTEFAKPAEHPVTKVVESVTSPIPSTVYLGLALSSMAASLGLMASGRRDTALFVGQWAPAFLIMGVYNKLVKQLGSD